MTHRDRFLRCLLGEEVDRLPFWLWFYPWPTALERWEREATPEEVANRHALFGTDPWPVVADVNLGPCPAFERKVLEEDDDYVTFIDRWGIKCRDYKRGMSMPEFLKFPVADRADWERFRDTYLDPDDPERLAGDWRDACREAEAQDIPILVGEFPWLTIFGGLRWLLGDEECLLAFYTMPDLVHEIMEHLTDVYVTVIEKVAQEFRIDELHIWEDMCGRQGSLISPAHWREFMGGPYRRLNDVCRRCNIPIMSVDTDGQPDAIIPEMVETGVNYIWPWEVAAGCDVNVIRERYPNIGMYGGIDKRALAIDPAAIDRELERVRPAMEKGRYIPAIDHCVPDDVSWQNYCHYARQLKKMTSGAK